MVVRLAVDVGCTTVVAAAQDGLNTPPRLIAFEGEDGPAGTLVASLTWSADGLSRAGIEADRALDRDPHRGVRGPLAHLQSGSSTLELEHGPVPVVAMVAELLARPLRALTRESGSAPAEAVLTIPSGWPPDGRRARALRAAAALAGLPPVTLVASAIAAAELMRDADAAIVLVCDVGGRSCELSLVDLRDGAGRLLATTEMVIGADLFDELLYLEILRELDERDSDAARRLEEFHLHAGATAAAADATEWADCQAGLARAVRHAREALTGAATHELAIGAPVGITLELEQQRARDILLTESLIIAGAAREQLAQAEAGGARSGARSEHVRVLLVGGGALTPGLRDTLEAELDLPVVVDEDPATVVVRGALPAVRRPVDPPPAAPRRPALSRRSAPVHQTLRTVLEDVVAATMSGGDVVAVVRHDSHHRVVRIDSAGRVGAAHTVSGVSVGAVAATPAAVVVWSASAAIVLTTGLRPLVTIERPLLATAAGATVWVVSAGDEQAPVLKLSTLAIEGREARTRAVERIGLAASQTTVRLPRRVARPVRPSTLAVVAGDRMVFAVPARGRGGTAAQRVGEAGRAGLGPIEMITGPEWVTGLAPSPAGGVISVRGWTRLMAGERRLRDWPVGTRVRLAAHATQAPWVVAARESRWEALRIQADEVVSSRAGDGAVERIGADEDGLWLVCESGGERRLVRVGATGELQRLAALGAPLEPLGRSGGEILTLAGAPGAPRTLVAITPG